MARLLRTPELCTELEARGVGVWSIQAVQSWIRWDNPCPVAQRGGPGRPHLFDPEAVTEWLEANRDRVIVGGVDATADISNSRPAGRTPGQPNDPRLERDRQRARLLKLKADEIERTHIHRREVEALCDFIVSTAEAVFEGLFARIAARADEIIAVEASERVAICKVEIERAFNEMASTDLPIPERRPAGGESAELVPGETLH